MPNDLIEQLRNEKAIEPTGNKYDDGWNAAIEMVITRYLEAAQHSVQSDGASRPRCTVCGTTDHHIDDKGRVVPNPPRR